METLGGGGEEPGDCRRVGYNQMSKELRRMVCLGEDYDQPYWRMLSKSLGIGENRTPFCSLLTRVLLFACELGTADEGECGGRRNQLLCYP